MSQPSPIIKMCRKCKGAGWKATFPNGKLTYRRCNKCLGARGRYGYLPGMLRAIKWGASA